MWRWLLLVLLMAMPLAMAEEPQVYPRQGVQVFLGLDDTSAPTQVQDGRAEDIQNIRLDISRAAQKRHGISVIGDILDVPQETFQAITGIYYTKFSSGVERIMATISNRAYFLNGSTWTLINGTPTSAITGGQDNQFVFTTAFDDIVFTNNVNPPIRWGGGTSEALSFFTFSGLSDPIERAKTVAFFKNFLIFGNTKEASTNQPTRIRWANIGTIDTWSNEDFVDISALGGQEINGMYELYDNLYIFLTDSIFKLSFVGGADTFQLSKVTDDIGCIAKNSIQSITLTNSQNGLIFLDKDKKVYFFNGVAAQDITPFIQTTMRGLGGIRLPFSVSADTNAEYILCTTVSTGDVNDLCLVFQYEIGEWTKYVNLPANAMAHVLDANAQDQVFIGSYKSFVYQIDDPDQQDDVGSATGTVQVVDRFTTSTASSIQVIYNATLNLTSGILVGAPLEIIGGTGIGQTNTVITNTNTGIVVADTFATPLDSTSTFEIGAIDAFFTSKWYDCGDSARLKHFGEVYFWADADVTSTMSLSYATDFNSDVSTQAISLSSSDTDAIWGSAIWGVSIWGDVDTVFRQAKMETQGRYLRVKFAEDDPGESFRIYGWASVYWTGDVN